MAQGKLRLKKYGVNIMKHKKSGGSIKKNKGKTTKGRKNIPSKKNGPDPCNTKRSFEKLLKQKVESEAIEKVSVTEPRSLRIVK
ncbi:hypothetical protein ECG_08799 [Echinococcus granulosus]|uniref:Expressed conserved protein n=1 Tax=Echinococcus granulosus TaxID=6210 RepID=A0A068WU21_ECHGR|nr:hypothetical protein ECG_08799 [Echinococcus granulosus]CDS23665.1 expressed conserved protein [Echinococcus granulosus]